jgi:hypothetical protein
VTETDTLYLIRDSSDTLHTYERADVLRMHLAEHKGEKVTVYKRELSATGAVRFVPMAEEELRTLRGYYSITREQCQAAISGVCSGCGGELVPIGTVDNAGDPTFWSGCMRCSMFDGGCDPLVFRVARAMVTEHHFVPYRHMQRPSDGAAIGDAYTYWLTSQTKGAVTTVREIKHLLEEYAKESTNGPTQTETA